MRFILHAVPLLVLLLALFGFAVELLDFEPRSGSVIKLALFEQPRVLAQVVIGAWLVEAAGLLALYLLAQGRCGAWWLDGLVAGWLGWVFRGPLLVITIVVAARLPQQPWWTLAFGWWVLYSVCGLSLAILARRSGLGEEPARDLPRGVGKVDEKPDSAAPLAEGPEAEDGPEALREETGAGEARAGEPGEDPDLRYEEAGTEALEAATEPAENTEDSEPAKDLEPAKPRSGELDEEP